MPATHRFLLPAALSLAALAGLGSAAAQAPARGLADVSLAELMNTPIYSASRYSQPASEAPASVTVVTREQISQAGYRTLADILRSVRGFYISYDRQRTYVGVRGFSFSGDNNTRVLLMIDGHRMNDSIFEQALVGNEFSLNIDLIEQVEIIRGPSSSLYGTNAMFAVINVITRKPDSIHGLELSGSAASYNTDSGRATYGHRFAGVDTLLSATFLNSKGHNQLYFPEYNYPAANFGIASHVDMARFTDLFASAAGHGLRLQAAYNNSEKTDPTASTYALFNDPRNRFLQSHSFVDLRYDHALGGAGSFTARTYFDSSSVTSETERLTAARTPANNASENRGQSLGFEAQATTRLRDRYKLVAGFEYRSDFHQRMIEARHAPVDAYTGTDHSTYFIAPYFEGELPLGHGFSLSPSVRQDYSPTYGFMTSPRAALDFRQGRTDLKLIYGESFRSPASWELYSDPTTGALVSERISTWEGDWNQTLSSSLALTASVYFNNLHNAIEASWVPPASLPFHNEEPEATDGLELELHGHWSNGIRSTASYSNTFVQQDDHQTWFENSPKNTGQFQMSVPVLREKLFATLDSQYVGRRLTQHAQHISPYAVMNVTLFGQKLTHNLDLSVSLYNALNKTFYDPADPRDPEARIQQDGRNFRAKLTWTLGAAR